MVRRSILMPPRSRAGADASAHVGHAPRLLGRRGGDWTLKEKSFDMMNEEELVEIGRGMFLKLSKSSQISFIDYLLSLSATASEPKLPSFVRSREVHNIS